MQGIQKKWECSREFKLLLLLFGISVLFRGIVAAYTGEYVVFYDELLHSKIAQGIANGKISFFRGQQIAYSEILYSLVIAPAFAIFKNFDIAHTAVMWINAVLMSSAAFPVYLLGKKFLTKQWTIWSLVTYSLLIGEMTYTVQVIQENLFYPLMMWALWAFTYIVLEKNDSKKNMCLLGCLAFVLSICKQMALILVVAWVLYFIIEIAFFSNERKKSILNFLLFLLAFFIFSKLYHLAFECVVPDPLPIGASSVIEMIKNVLDWNTLKQFIYLGVVYVFFTVLSTGIFPIPIILGSLRKLTEKEKQLVAMIACYVFVAIATICITIGPLEKFGTLTVNIRTRYYFYIFIPIIMLFLKIMESPKWANSAKNNSAVFLIGIGFLATTIPLTPGVACHIDAVSAGIYGYLSGNDQEIVLKQILFIIILVTGIFLINGRGKGICILTGCVLLVGTIFASYHVLELNYPRKEFGTATRQDAVKLSDYIHQQSTNGEEDVLLLISDNVLMGDSVLSDGGFEPYFSPAYHCARYNDMIDNWKSRGEVQFSSLPYHLMNSTWNDETGKEPTYIICSKELSLLGYELVELGLNQYHLYERTTGSIAFEYVEQGVYSDKWISNPVEIAINGNEGGDMAVLTLSVNSPLFEHDLDLEYIDGCGNKGTVTVPPANTFDEITTIEVPIQKAADEKVYSVSLSPQETMRVGDDPRDLSFRLYDVQIRY